MSDRWWCRLTVETNPDRCPTPKSCLLPQPPTSTCRPVSQKQIRVGGPSLSPAIDIHLEVLLVLDADGRWSGRAIRRAVNLLYRLHCRLLLAIIQAAPRPPHPLPAIGHEPFNLTPQDLAREWEQRLNLTPTDLAKLASSGIPAELAQQAKLRRVESREGGELIGRNGSGDYAGVIFPYIWPGESGPREYRLRRDRPELEYKDGKPKERAKYLTAPGRGNLLYFVPEHRQNGSVTQVCPR